MTPIAAMVVEMIARGVDPEVIAIAVSAAEQAVAMSARPQISADISADRRREKDRLRKQSVRGIPQMSADIPQTTEIASTKEVKKEEIKEEVEAAQAKRPQTNRGHRLPDEWSPQGSDWVDTIQKLTIPGADHELLKFRDYWKSQPGQRGVKLDWDATWRNWIRNAKGSHGAPQRPLTQHQVERQESREILNDLQKFIDGNGSCGDANPGLLRLDSGDGQESFHGGFHRNVVDIPFGSARKGD